MAKKDSNPNTTKRLKGAKKTGSARRDSSNKKIQKESVAPVGDPSEIYPKPLAFSEDLFEPVTAAEFGFEDDELIQEAKKTVPAVEVKNDDWSHLLLKRIAEAESETPWLQTDPIKEKVESIRHLLPMQGRGMRFKACSQRVTGKKGRRNWEPLTHPQTNEPIMVQGMTLCWMPEISAKRRNQHYQEIGNEAIREAQENFSDSTKQIARDAAAQGVSGIEPLEPDDVLVNNDNRDPERMGQQEVVGVELARGDLRKAGHRVIGDSVPIDMDALIEAVAQRQAQRETTAG